MAKESPTAAAPRAPYHVERDAVGGLSRVHRVADGREVVQDPSQQAFCDFLTYASHPSRSREMGLASIYRPGAYFADLGAFLSHCKTLHAMLFVGGSLVSGKRSITTGQTRFALPGPSGPVNFLTPSVCVASADAKGTRFDAGVVGAPWEGVFVTSKLHEEANEQLNTEGTIVRWMSSWPEEKTFVYLDVSDFSRHPAGQQALIVNSLLMIVDNDHYWAGPELRTVRASRIAHLCIGDGYIFVFDRAVDGVYFAAYLARTIEVQGAKGGMPVEFHFRAGVHCGPAYRFWDTGRSGWNFIGQGINEGHRVLESIEKTMDDVIFISGAVKQRLERENDGNAPYPQMLATLQNRGRRTDKHGEWRRVYELNFGQLVTTLVPGHGILF